MVNIMTVFETRTKKTEFNQELITETNIFTLSLDINPL